MSQLLSLPLIYSDISMVPRNTEADYNTSPLGRYQTPGGFLLFLPTKHYPLKASMNECILKWFNETMPTGASFVDVTPFSFRSFSNFGPFDQNPGYTPPSGTTIFEIFKFTFNEFVTVPTDFVIPHPFRIRKTAADPMPATTQYAPALLREGTRHAFPIADPYIGFLVEHDGIVNTGLFSMSVDLRGSGE